MITNKRLNNKIFIDLIMECIPRVGLKITGNKDSRVNNVS